MWPFRRRASDVHVSVKNMSQPIARGLAAGLGEPMEQVADALLALGDHRREPGEARNLPVGAIDTLGVRIMQGDQEIANAIRSLTAAIREHAHLSRLGLVDQKRAEAAVAAQVEREKAQGPTGARCPWCRSLRRSTRLNVCAIAPHTWHKDHEGRGP